jgi:hypothetical protein
MPYLAVRRKLKWSSQIFFLQNFGPNKCFVWLKYTSEQGCQMVYFQPKNQKLGKFGRALNWKILVYFMDIWKILWPFGIFNGLLVIYIVLFGIFPPVWVHCMTNDEYLATLLQNVFLSSFLLCGSLWVRFSRKHLDTF